MEKRGKHVFLPIPNEMKERLTAHPFSAAPQQIAVFTYATANVRNAR
jgi:hypothetical protein